MHCQVLPQLVWRVNQRRGKNRQSRAPGDGEGLRAVGGDANRGMGLLHRLGGQEQVRYAKVFTLV